VLLAVSALGFLLPAGGSALAESGYFVQIADPHVNAARRTSVGRWNRMLEFILAESPPPDLVVCSGDLVDFGAGPGGDLNYYALLGVPAMNTPEPYVHYLDDGEQQIPIFFAPGNHDYRTLSQVTLDLTNYHAEIHPATYFHEIVGSYALFSVNSGYDVFQDTNPLLPEGSGLFDSQPGSDLTNLESDLDALDGITNNTDTSSYKKIIFLHHYHCVPKDQTCSTDGAFVNHTPDFIRICEDFGVDWVLYGHLHPKESIVFDLYGGTWSPGETKCVVAVAAKDGKYRREGPGEHARDVMVRGMLPSLSAPSLAAMTLLLVATGAAVLWRWRRSVER
jgi:predicted MPP superfamily phosphohydrolase